MAWGGSQGFTPWIDSEGHDVIPLWASEAQARQESEQDSDPGETPVFLTLEQLLRGTDIWRAGGISEVGLHSEGGRFLLTLSVENFRDLIERCRDEPQVP